MFNVGLIMEYLLIDCFFFIISKGGDMPTKYLSYYLIILLITTYSIYSQGNFPVGAYINNQDENYAQIAELNFNWVVQKVHAGNKDSLADYNIICGNSSSTDVIHHATFGFYTVWEAEYSPPHANKPGYKTSVQNDDVTGTAMSGCRGAIVGTHTVNKYLLLGPDYIQRRTYKDFNNTVIDYKVAFYLRREGLASLNDDICQLEINYRSGSNIQNLETQTIKASQIDTLQYTEIIMTYHLPETINDNPVFEFDNETSEFIPTIDNFDRDVIDPHPPYGVQFNVKWLGNDDLYADKVIVYDDDIAFDNLITSQKIGILGNNINSYLADYITWDNTKYWYSTDEPETIDYFKPYRIVDSLVLLQGNNTSDGLLTAFYPYWSGLNNYESFAWRFNSNANPSKMMIDYYPYWPDSYNAVGLRMQREVFKMPLSRQGELFDPGDFFFIAQAHEYNKLESGNLICMHQYPTKAELNASVFLALAQGAKGVIFWNYYSYKYASGEYRIKGMVDVKENGIYETLDLWDQAKDISNKLRGEMGDSLLTTKYNGEFSTEKYGVNDDADISQDDIDFLELTRVSGDSLNFHIGLLHSKTNPYNKYLMSVNLVAYYDTTDSRLISEISNPFNDYTNIRIRSIGDSLSYDTTLVDTSNNSLIDTVVYTSGQGRLFQIAPVVKYGGKLICNETVDAPDTLFHPMTICENDTLFLENEYFVTDNIIIENSGKIELNQNGILKVKPGVNITLSSWSDSLLQARTCGVEHPAIYWAEYSSNINHYIVFYKYGSLAWDTLAIVTNTSCIDSNVVINNPGGMAGITASYKVAAVTNGPRPVTHNSNTITYDIQGQELEKKNTANNIPDKFSLYQNYPNPFNPNTIIRFDIPEISFVKIKIFDILGREIKSLAEMEYSPGVYELLFDASDFTSGVYFYSIETEKFKQTKKMIILK